MTALEFIATVAGIILGSSALTVLLNNLHDRWKIKQERKNNKEDKLEAKEDIVDDLQNATDSQEKKIEALEILSSNMAEALKYLLLDKILFLGSKYIRRNTITLEERKILKAMYNVYHNGLDGNGDADFIMKGVEAITPNEFKQKEANYDDKKED